MCLTFRLHAIAKYIPIPEVPEKQNRKRGNGFNDIFKGAELFRSLKYGCKYLDKSFPVFYAPLKVGL